MSQLLATGTHVRHYVDGDVGTIIEYRPATTRELEHYIVEWKEEQGPHAHLPDELITIEGEGRIPPMSRLLRINHPDCRADPYPIRSLDGEGFGSLAEAVGQEADVIAGDAGSDLLESPSDEHRAILREQVFEDAMRELRASGTYRDPFGIRWTLETSSVSASTSMATTPDPFSRVVHITRP